LLTDSRRKEGDISRQTDVWCLPVAPPEVNPAAVWIVRLALRRPYTFVVVSMLIAVLGVLSIASMPTDIFRTSTSP